MTPNEIRRRFPKASEAFYKANSAVAAQVPHAESEQVGGSEPIQGDEVKEGGKRRFRVCITHCGTRYLDPDNLAGAKLLIDELRYANLIQRDDPTGIELHLRQFKVPKDQIGTLIEIYPI